METIEVPVDEEIVDFTEPHKPKRFRLDGDVFTLVHDMPTISLLEFSDKVESFTKGTTAERIEAMKELFHLVLEPVSADLFINRMSDSKNPIGIKSVQKILPWLMEQYGLRPTQPSESSSDGSEPPESGISSTGEPPVVELT